MQGQALQQQDFGSLHSSRCCLKNQPEPQHPCEPIGNASGLDCLQTVTVLLWLQAEMDPHPALALVYPALALAPRRFWVCDLCPGQHLLWTGVGAVLWPHRLRRGSAPPWIPSPGAQPLAASQGTIRGAAPPREGDPQRLLRWLELEHPEFRCWRLEFSQCQAEPKHGQKIHC